MSASENFSKKWRDYWRRNDASGRDALTPTGAARLAPDGASVKADVWRSPASASPGLILFAGIEQASEEIVDLLAMAAIESGAPAEALRGQPRIYAHLESIAKGEFS